jgi:hypothetical protein
MKNLIIGLVLLSTTCAFAQKMTYENLPVVKTFVTSTDLASQVDSKHEQRQKEALEELRRHVESTLGRQYITGKCSSVVKERFNNPGFASRSSTCSVSFL